MSNYIIQGQTLTDIADAIRDKTGSNGLITPEDMPTAIESIETGGGSVAPACGIVPTEYYDTSQSINGYGHYGLVKKAKVYSNNGHLPSGFMCNFETGNYQGAGQYAYVEDVDWSGVTVLPIYIGVRSFGMMENVKKMIVPERIFSEVINVGDYAFYMMGRRRSSDITENYVLKLPKIQTIGSRAFYYCYPINEVEIGPDIKTIGTQAFRYNYRCTKITFLGTPTSIGTNAFGSQNSMLGCTMYVPWSEGAVAGAPWGFNGTIVYDYVPPTE